jgi:hypothetical protein
MGYIIYIYSYTKIKEQLQCSSYGAKTMKNKREIHIVPKTRSPEVDYPPSSW